MLLQDLAGLTKAAFSCSSGQDVVGVRRKAVRLCTTAYYLYDLVVIQNWTRRQ
jgi:hypothetical protein